MKKSYIITNDVKVPLVLESGQAHKSAQIRFKLLKKGTIVKGELKHSNNKPSFVLVGRMGVIPLSCVQEVVSTPIVSIASGTETTENRDSSKDVIIEEKSPKIKYADAMLIGGLVGFLGVYYAQKNNYIDADESKYKLYGALGGGILAMYFVFRNNNKPKITVSKPKPTL